MSATLTYTPGEKDRNINGVVHGGVIFHFCDDAVAQYVSGQGLNGAAADANIHYYRPARVGEEMTATVTERKVGKRLGVYLVEVWQEKLIADCLFTVAFAARAEADAKNAEKT